MKGKLRVQIRCSECGWSWGNGTWVNVSHDSIPSECGGCHKRGTFGAIVELPNGEAAPTYDINLYYKIVPPPKFSE